MIETGSTRAVLHGFVLWAFTTLAGCFFYDSSWGQAKAAQQHVAAQRSPKFLRGEAEAKKLSREEGSSPGLRTLRIQVFATRRYAAETLDWQRQFESVLQDANPTLRRDFGIELSVAQYRVWTAPKSDDNLHSLLEELATEDAAGDSDWLVGLASAVPGLAESPDQLGVGAVLGKRLVIRAMSDAEEFDAIQRGFTEISESEKQKLYLARKRHKSAAVLLHELGHTLGIPHELEADTLMNARYSHLASDFSERAQALGKLTLSYRAGAGSNENPNSPEREQAPERAWAEHMISLVNGAPPHTWEPATRDALLATLELHRRLPALALGAPQPSEALAGTSGMTGTTSALAPAPDLSALTDADRAIFQRIVAEQRANHKSEAWQLGSGLFGAYPDVYAVQNLRCELAMAIGGPWEAIRRECDHVLKQGVPGRKPTRATPPPAAKMR